MKQKASAISSVLETAKQETKAPLLAGVETLIWTENMLAALDNGVKGGKIPTSQSLSFSLVMKHGL